MLRALLLLACSARGARILSPSLGAFVDTVNATLGEALRDAHDVEQWERAVGAREALAELVSRVESAELTVASSEGRRSVEAELYRLLQSDNFTFSRHVDTVSGAIAAYGPSALAGASSAVQSARGHIRSRLDVLFGDYPLVATLCEWLSVALPCALLVAGFLHFREGWARFSVASELLLLFHIYWSIYYGLLGAVSVLSWQRQPLAAFAADQTEQYVAYQVLILILFILYIACLVFHAVFALTAEAAVQLAGGTIVYLHSYMTTLHPAIVSHAPPASSPLWFVVYALLFFAMTLVISEERKRKAE